MVKRCVYCRASLDDTSVVDVCRKCGIGVWGERMFNTITENMNKAQERGDLSQGLITLQQDDVSVKNPSTKTL